MMVADSGLQMGKGFPNGVAFCTGHPEFFADLAAKRLNMVGHNYSYGQNSEHQNRKSLNSSSLNRHLQPELETPKTAESLTSLRKQIEESIAQGGEMDGPCKNYIQKLANAAENAFTDRTILLDENSLLFDQNCERNTRKSIKATVVGSAKVMSYEDIVEAQKQRDLKEAAAEVTQGRRSKRNPAAQVLGKRSRGQELEEAEHEIRALGLEEYCSMLRF
jgi:hypothetical protein